MKFKEKRGNKFLFDFGLRLEKHPNKDKYYCKGVWVTKELNISLDAPSHINDIQAAVNLMQILIKEGLV